MRRLRQLLEVESLPYVLVPEYHRDGHVHLHALLDRHVPKELLGQAWGRGFVDVRKFKGESAREGARQAAGYAAKYVAKTWELEAEGVEVGRHRYEVGEGWQPQVVKRTGYRSLTEALDWVVEGHGQAVSYAVHSDGLEDYEGPPFIWCVLDGQPPP